MKRREIQEWMRGGGHSAMARAFSHRGAIVAHEDRMFAPRTPGASAVPPLPPVYRARAALIPQPRPAHEGVAQESLGSAAVLEHEPIMPQMADLEVSALGGSEEPAADEVGALEGGASDATTLVDASVDASPTLATPNESSIGDSVGDTGVALSSSAAGSPVPVGGAASAPMGSARTADPRARAVAPEGAVVERERPTLFVPPLPSLDNQEAPHDMSVSPSAAREDARTARAVADSHISMLSAEGEALTAADNAEVAHAIAPESGATAHAPMGEIHEPDANEVSISAEGTGAAQPEEASQHERAMALGQALAASHAASLGESREEGATSQPQGERTRGTAQTAERQTPQERGAASAPTPATPPAATSSSSGNALAGPEQPSAPLDPFVAHVLAVLRGEKAGPWVSPASEGEATAVHQNAGEAEAGALHVEATAATPSSAPSAAPIAAASKGRDAEGKEPISLAASSATAATAASAGEEPAVPRIDASIDDARSRTSPDENEHLTRPEEVAELESAGDTGELESGQPGLSISTDAPGALSSEPASAPPGMADRPQTLSDPVHDANVREIRHARPLPPEIAKRLAEAKSSAASDQPAARQHAAESADASQAQQPNEDGEDAAPINPLLWLERLREAARIEAAGGREKYREMQARAAKQAIAPARGEPARRTTSSSAAKSPSDVLADAVRSPSRRESPNDGASVASGTRGGASGDGAVSTPAPAPVAAASRTRTFVPPVAHADEEKALGASAASSGAPAAVGSSDRDLEQAIASTPPASLGEPARAFLRPLLGVDPASVPLHEGVDAGAAAAARDADALAVGERILAPPAAASGNTPESLGLLAHEVTHVARRRSPSFVPPLLRDDAVERPGGAARTQALGASTVGGSEGGEEEIALATERAVRAEARAAQGSAERAAEPNEYASAAALYTAPVWNRGDAPASSSMARGSGEEQRHRFGDFPAPGEPIAFPSEWNQGGDDAFESRQSSERLQVATQESPSSSTDVRSAGAPVHTARTGRDAESAPSDTTHGDKHGDEHSARHEDGEELDRLAAQVYQVLRRRLLAERRRGG